MVRARGKGNEGPLRVPGRQCFASKKQADRDRSEALQRMNRGCDPETAAVLLETADPGPGRRLAVMQVCEAVWLMGRRW